MIAAMILFTIAIGMAVWCITVSSMTKSEMWLLFLIFSLFCALGGIAAIDVTPTNTDVRKGRAHYVEQNHVEIANGDTVNNYKTYEIVWIENSKSQ
jgi:hypothetical protein